MARIDPRVVEVLVVATRNGKEGFTTGSGYLLTPSVVLTARHLLEPEDGWTLASVEARPIGLADFAAVSAHWVAANADVALLDLAKPVVGVPTASVSLRWGRVAGAARVRCRAVGFPRARKRSDAGGRPVLDPEPVEGLLEPGTAAKDAASMDLHAQGAVPREAGADSFWKGQSGAAVFVGPWLVGVVASQPPSFGPDRLSVDLLDAVVSQAGFMERCGPAALETADLPRWLNPPYEILPSTASARSALLLKPKFGVVSFRECPELDDLLAWCRSNDPYAVALVTADGGQGKTRLAAELCVRLTEEGWLAGFLNEEPVEAADVPGGQVLLVVDYAESLGLPRARAAVAACRRLLAPARVLLLARNAGSWWKSLPVQLAAGEELVDGVQPRELVPLVATRERQVEEFRLTAAAIAAFRHLEGPLPEPPPDVRAAGFSNPFLIQLSALTSVDPGEGVAFDEDVLDRALRREDEKYWLPLAREYGVYDERDSRRRDDAVAIATLTAPRDDGRAASLLATLPDLGDDDRRARARAWIHAAYPPDTVDGQGLGPLEPDLLGERLVERFVTRAGGVERLIALVEIADTDETARLLAVLNRVAIRSTAARSALENLLSARLASFVADVRADDQSPLAQVMADSFSIAPILRLAQGLADDESASFALAPLRAVAAELLVHAAATTDERVSALDTLSDHLGKLGRWDEALAAMEEAVENCRSLAEADPDLLPALAIGLNTLTRRLGELGRWDEALAAIEEAVELCRNLTDVRPSAIVQLVVSLNNLSIPLGELGRREEALAAIEEAVEHRRRLAEGRPDAFLF